MLIKHMLYLSIFLIYKKVYYLHVIVLQNSDAYETFTVRLMGLQMSSLPKNSDLESKPGLFQINFQIK